MLQNGVKVDLDRPAINDIRQQLSDAAIKDMLSEIDADTIKRFSRGERLLPLEGGGHVWSYLVDANNKLVNEHGYLLDNDGNPTQQLGTFRGA